MNTEKGANIAMKDSFKKRIRTAEKDSIYASLVTDGTINRLCSDLLKAGAEQVHIICLVVYCYQLGLERGYKKGFVQGRSAGIKLVHDEVFKHDGKGEV